MTCSWNRYLGCFTAPGWEPGISPHLCAFCLQASKTGKWITLWAHLHAGTAISVQEGQMCKRRLLHAFSSHIAACHTSRKLVTCKNCKEMLLRNLFSNPDLRPVAPEPVRPQKLHSWPGHAEAWHVSLQGGFRSMFDLLCLQPRSICRCKSKPQRHRKASPVHTEENPFDPWRCTNALLQRRLSSCVFETVPWSTSDTTGKAGKSS